MSGTAPTTSIPANVLSTITTVLKAVGGFFVAKGTISQSIEDNIIGGLLIVLPLAWSFIQNHWLLHATPKNP